MTYAANISSFLPLVTADRDVMLILFFVLLNNPQEPNYFWVGMKGCLKIMFDNFKWWEQES